MLVYRLHRAIYPDPLSGIGASLRGGRWNSQGVSLVYTSSSRALALAEVAVHLSLANLPNDFLVASLFLPDSLSMKRVNLSDLPDQWNEFPVYEATQQIGDQFVYQQKYPVLQVPSAIIPEEFNVLLNPYHPDFSQIKVVESKPFKMDRRLFI